MAGTARVAGAYLDVRPELSADFVNELVRGFKKAFDQVEDIARKAGKSMADDVDRQLRRSGDGLAQGVQSGWRDANGRLRNELGQFVAEAKDAGGDAGVGMADGMAGGIEGAEAGPQGAMAGIGVGLVAAAGAAGVLAGAKFMEGLSGSMEREKVADLFAAQLGLSPEEQKEAGALAGDLFANGYGESMGDVYEAIRAVNANIGKDLPEDELKELSALTMDWAMIMGKEPMEVTRAVGSLMKNGLAPNAEAAFDIIARGFQTTQDPADDLLDTVNEYSTKFRDLGLDGATSMGLLNQAIAAGARDTDYAADTLKEFSIRAIDGSQSTADGFAAIGLNAADMAKKIAAGGPESAAALDLTLDRLRAIEDPVLRDATAVQLFGTKAEDLGDALYAMDPSEAAAGLGEVGDAAATASATLNDNTATWWETIKRTFTKPFTDWFDLSVNPIMRDFATAFAEDGAGGLAAKVREKWPAIQAGLEAWWVEDVLPWARENGPKIVAALGEGVAWAAEAGAGLFERVMPALGDFLVSVGEWAQNTAVPYVQEHWGEWWDTIVASFQEGGVTARAIEALNGFMWTVGSWIASDLLPWAAGKSVEIGHALMGWLLVDAPMAAWNALWAVGESGIAALAAAWNLARIPQFTLGPWTVSAFGKSLDIGPFGPFGPFDFPDIQMGAGPGHASRGNGVTAFADGGVIPASMGPVLGLLNEAPNTPGEAIIPLDRFDEVLGGGGVQVTQHVYGADLNPSLLADLASRRMARALAVAA